MSHSDIIVGLIILQIAATKMRWDNYDNHRYPSTECLNYTRQDAPPAAQIAILELATTQYTAIITSASSAITLFLLYLLRVSVLFTGRT